LAVQKSPSARSDSLIYTYGELPGTVERTRLITDLMTGVVGTAVFNQARLREELERGFSQATDVAEVVMLTSGIDYRSAYKVVGHAVRALSAEGLSGRDLTVERLQQAAREVLGTRLSIDAAALASALDTGAVVATRLAVGGAAAGPMGAMLSEVAEEAGALEHAIRSRLDGFDRAEAELRHAAARVVGT
jgi:argininosuccinate lyase